MKAKLINGIIENFQQPDWLLGDATDYAIEQGFKDVIYREGNNGAYETDTNIIVEIPPVPELSVSERRINAFKYEKNINFKGVLISVDEAVITYQSYMIESSVADSDMLRDLIISAKNEIRERIM